MLKNFNNSEKSHVPILQIKHLSKVYPEFMLNSIDLDFQTNTIIGLLGRNGAGKSTLIKCALGLIPINAGTIYFRQQELRYGSAIWRQAVGYVAESPILYDWMRVGQFFKFISTYYAAWDNEYCKQLIDGFQLDEGKQIRDLSHGMRVKVALIAALSYHPTLLILDEPTSGLDPAARVEFLREVRDIVVNDNSRMRAVIISSHVLEDILSRVKLESCV